MGESVSTVHPQPSRERPLREYADHDPQHRKGAKAGYTAHWYVST
jgi:hypothetical protein